MCDGAVWWLLDGGIKRIDWIYRALHRVLKSTSFSYSPEAKKENEEEEEKEEEEKERKNKICEKRAKERET